MPFIPIHFFPCFYKFSGKHKSTGIFVQKCPKQIRKSYFLQVAQPRTNINVEIHEWMDSVFGWLICFWFIFSQSRYVSLVILDDTLRNVRGRHIDYYCYITKLIVQRSVWLVLLIPYFTNVSFLLLSLSLSHTNNLTKNEILDTIFSYSGIASIHQLVCSFLINVAAVQFPHG